MRRRSLTARPLAMKSRSDHWRGAQLGSNAGLGFSFEGPTMHQWNWAELAALGAMFDDFWPDHLHFPIYGRSRRGQVLSYLAVCMN